MDPWERRSPYFVALRVAVIYATFGILWIVFSDQIASAVAASAAQLTFIQTIKGGAFVMISAIIIFGLVYREHDNLVRTNEDLESALQQVHILHRILRHNLRNITSIIGGKISKLDRDGSGPRTDHIEVLSRQNERLINLSNKSRYLKQFLMEETAENGGFDLVTLVETEVEKGCEKFPDARIHAEMPTRALVAAHGLIDGAIEELIENAIQHNHSNDQAVWITVDADSEWVTLTVEDNGPGIPTTERSALLSKYETALDHSQGLGLWLVQLTVRASNGKLALGDSDRRGAKVEITLPKME